MGSLKAQADALVLALFGKRDLTALEHVKDGLRKIEDSCDRGSVFPTMGFLERLVTSIKPVEGTAVQSSAASSFSKRNS